RSHGHPEWDEEHKRVQRVYIGVRDITERKKMEVVEREQRTLLEALLDNSITLTSTLNFEEVLDRIMGNIGKVMPHDSASIMLIEAGKVRIVRAYGYEKMPGGLDFVKNVNYSVAEIPNYRMMVETGHPLVIPDVYKDTNWVPHPWAAWIRSYAGVPI